MPFASTEFEQLMLNRIQYIQQFLLWNFTVFLNDCDTVWSVSPTAIYPSKNDIKHFDIFAQDGRLYYHLSYTYLIWMIIDMYTDWEYFINIYVAVFLLVSMAEIILDILSIYFPCNPLDLSMYHKEPPMACTGNLMYAPNQATIQIWGTLSLFILYINIHY